MKAQVSTAMKQLQTIADDLGDVEQYLHDKHSSAEDRNREDHIDLWLERIEQLDEVYSAIREAAETLEQIF